MIGYEMLFLLDFYAMRLAAFLILLGMYQGLSLWIGDLQRWMNLLLLVVANISAKMKQKGADGRLEAAAREPQVCSKTAVARGLLCPSPWEESLWL